MPFYVTLALSAFLISLLGTRLLILTLRKSLLLVDRPNIRSNHVTPTPRGGGLAVVMALVICLMMADVNYGIVLAVFLLAAVSLLDDLIGNVPAVVRLLVQLLAVLIPLNMIHTPAFAGLLPMWLDKTVTAILWIWFINLFNFMDGIDGISAVEMISISLGICLMTIIHGMFPDALSSYGMVIAAAGCGFLWWNWHPAKIFLGDVGSVPIGFLLGYLLLLASASGYTYAALILPAYYLSDGTITIVRRAWQRKKIWVAHSEHYYQRAVRGGRRHDSVARYIIGLNLLLGMLATLSMLDPALAPLYLAVAYMAVFMMLGFFAHTERAHYEPF